MKSPWSKDLHRGRSGRRRTNLSYENVEKVSDVLYDDGIRKSIHKVSATTGLSSSSVRDILLEAMETLIMVMQ